MWSKQIASCCYKNDIEINISDNGSNDDTQSMVSAFCAVNTTIRINYRRNEYNLGPDRNYILAMKMAEGEYSILWSDDDYPKEDALNYIIKQLLDNRNVSVFVSNRTIWINGEIDAGVEYFINPIIETRIFDFSSFDQKVSYFSNVVCLGGLFTYIPSIIYKTEVIHLYEYDGSLNGTCYAFMFYWWQYLLEGRSLMYLNTSYIDCTLGPNDNFGKGIDRVLVDFIGLKRVSERLEMDELTKKLFLKCLRCTYGLIALVNLRLYSDREKFDRLLLPILDLYGYNNAEIQDLQNSTKFKFCFSNLMAVLFPRFTKLMWSLYNKLK